MYPGWQFWHVIDPSEFVKVPAVQAVQALLMNRDEVPGAQAVQLVEPESVLE